MPGLRKATCMHYGADARIRESFICNNEELMQCYNKIMSAIRRPMTRLN